VANTKTHITTQTTAYHAVNPVLITTCRHRAERWRGGDKERNRDRKEV